MKSYSVLFILAAGLLALFPGCAGKSDPARFYQISPTQAPVSQVVFDAATPGPIIGVGPVKLAAYLGRSQIVTRTGSNRLNLSEFDKWAEPLEENISRLVLSGLTARLRSRNLSILPWQDKANLDYQLTVTVLQMDNSPGGDAVLVSRWALFDPQGRMLISQISSLKSPVKSTDDFQGLAMAQSQNVDALCQEMAGAIEKKVR